VIKHKKRSLAYKKEEIFSLNPDICAFKIKKKCTTEETFNVYFIFSLKDKQVNYLIVLESTCYVFVEKNFSFEKLYL
jgi:hypothetical protein